MLHRTSPWVLTLAVAAASSSCQWFITLHAGAPELSLDGRSPDGSSPATDGDLAAEPGDGGLGERALDLVSDLSTPDGPCLAGDLRCQGDQLLRCTAGAWSPDQLCAAGCDPAAGRCRRVRPSNAVDPLFLAAGTTPLAPTADVLLDTGTGTVSGGFTAAVVQGPSYSCGGAQLGWTLFAFSQITIPAGVTLRIRGPRAAVLVAGGSISIAGRVELGGGRDACAVATPDCAGPGGFAGGLGLDVNPTAGGGPGGGGGGFSFDGYGCQHSCRFT